MVSLETLIWISGLAHLGILGVAALVPAKLDWRSALAPLPAALRQLMWVYGVFIFLTVLGFAALSLALAPDLAAGTALARAVCGGVAVFWLIRLAVQLFVFDLRRYLDRWYWRWGYHGLTPVFLFLAVVYGVAALR